MWFIKLFRENFGENDEYRLNIDAGPRGNAGRFFNHSCGANCILQPVRIENQFPRIGIFAAQNIDPGEELCYNYGDFNSQLGDTKCACGHHLCRGFMPCEDP